MPCWPYPVAAQPDTVELERHHRREDERERVWRHKEEARRVREEKEKALFKAATTIQRYFRGYAARRRYGDVKVNDIVRRRAPDLYMLEAIIRDVVAKEMIPDMLVELCEDAYYPISKSANLRAHRIRYHIMEETLAECIRDCVSEVVVEFADSCLSAPPDPVTVCLHDIINETVDEILSDVAGEAVVESAEDYVVESQCRDIFEDLLAEVADEMGILRQTKNEMLQVAVWDDLVDVEIDDQLQGILDELSMQLKIPIRPVHRPKPKSRTLNTIMEYILDTMVLERLVDHVASGGATVVAEEVVQRVADESAMEALVDEFVRLSSVVEEETGAPGD
ncbi:hypothetical protein HK104_010907 [Borealophlyctis nickersoniae]|nr:hypothetical protein HK104_010907 [Borealophlyctis nickersoniae]